MLSACAVLACTTAGPADVVTEFGDAGDRLDTAQITIGVNDLTAITGALENGADADMYLIRIFDVNLFSATTNGPGTLYDSQLFLFDAGGLGICANDDISNPSPYNPHSILAAGSPLNPKTPGLYYLAVSGWDHDPHSAGGAMFVDDSQYTGTAAPAGPGGALPLTGWDGPGDLNGALGNYTILLTGASYGSASIPEPGTWVLLVLGLMCVSPRRGRQRA